MRLVTRLLLGRFFRDLDRPMENLREIRDSYRAINVEIYGARVASMLNDW
jgi:hypothetical protein